MEITAYIALGSNLGERAETLVSAVKQLNAVAGVCVRRLSNFIETEPVGPPDQPKYLNGAVEVRTTLTAERLLEELHRIEDVLGRVRDPQNRWGPRTCDLDLLLYGQTVCRTPTLTLPHPQIAERAFVLRPLAQIAPAVVHPVLGRTIAELLAELECREG